MQICRIYGLISIYPFSVEIIIVVVLYHYVNAYFKNWWLISIYAVSVEIIAYLCKL